MAGFKLKPNVDIGDAASGEEAINDDVLTLTE